MSATPSPRNRVVELVVAGLIAGLAVGGVIWFRSARQTPVQPVPVVTVVSEVPRAELQRRDGRLYRATGSNAFTGWMIERYPDGALQSRSMVSNGLLEGLSEGWHTNGQRQVTEIFRAGTSDGLRTKWYASGRKMSETVIVNGQLQGRHRRWHDNGVLAEEVAMKDGQPDGLARAFFPSGSLKSEATLTQGAVVTQKFWHDGEVREVVERNSVKAPPGP